MRYPASPPGDDIVQHRQALPHKDVAAAVETVRASESVAPAIKLAFEFPVLTVARSGEVRLAKWDEMDTAGCVWTIPASYALVARKAVSGASALKSSQKGSSCSVGSSIASTQ